MKKTTIAAMLTAAALSASVAPAHAGVVSWAKSVWSALTTPAPQSAYSGTTTQRQTITWTDSNGVVHRTVVYKEVPASNYSPTATANRGTDGGYIDRSAYCSTSACQ